MMSTCVLEANSLRTVRLPVLGLEGRQGHHASFGDTSWDDDAPGACVMPPARPAQERVPEGVRAGRQPAARGSAMRQQRGRQSWLAQPVMHQLVLPGPPPMQASATQQHAWTSEVVACYRVADMCLSANPYLGIARLLQDVRNQCSRRQHLIGRFADGLAGARVGPSTLHECKSMMRFRHACEGMFQLVRGFQFLNGFDTF